MKKDILSLSSTPSSWLEKTAIIFLGLFLLLIAIQSAKSAEYILGTAPKSTTTSAVTGSVFTRTLQMGMSGQDVSALQAIVNIVNNTAIPVTGEFDATTKNAVNIFQEKYPVDILIPAGLVAGNGFAGTSTIAKLNTLATQYNIKLSDFKPVVITASSSVVHTVNIFNRNLNIGDTGDDVILLKNILNSDKDTALSYINGKAPVGTENLYDDTTANAVTRFQEKYASEILTPIGLTKGTGIVGYATRVKLNKLAVALAKNATEQDSLVKNLPATAPIKKIIQTQNNNTETITAGFPHWSWDVGDWGSCTGEWVKCAQVGQYCRFVGISTIRFGNNNSWIYKVNVNGGSSNFDTYCDYANFDFNKLGLDFGFIGNSDWACYYFSGTETRNVTAKLDTRTMSQYISKETQLGPEPLANQMCNYIPDPTEKVVPAPTLQWANHCAGVRVFGICVGQTVPVPYLGF